MEGNPYISSGDLPDTRSASRFWLWSGVIGFALGFVVSWVLFQLISFVQLRPRDYTQSMQKELRESLPESEEWRKNAIGRKLGHFLVIVATGSKATAQLSPLKHDQFPVVLFDDEDSDGRVDSVHACDKSRRTFSFDIVDGQFKSYTYTNDVQSLDCISFRDGDMDGQFDMRVGPGRQYAAMIDSEWRDVIEEGGKRFIMLNGARTPIESVGDILKVVPEKNEE